MREKGGNFCISSLKIAEKEGKTDLSLLKVPTHACRKYTH
jgi:hypothetical protein